MRTVHIHCTVLLFETLFVLKLWTESVILESKAKEEENKKRKKDRNEKRKSQTHKQRKQVYCLAFFKNLKKKNKEKYVKFWRKKL